MHQPPSSSPSRRRRGIPFHKHPQHPLRASGSWLNLRNLLLMGSLGLMFSLYLLAAINIQASRQHDHALARSAAVAGEDFPGGSPQFAAAAADTTRRETRAGNEIAAEDNTDPPIHIIFSTSCSPFQDWQSLLVFMTADMVGQKGPLTRIASGCTPEEQKALEAVYAKLDRGRNKFRLHMTPDFSKDEATGDTYYFYNKPGGLKHWLESPASPPDDTIIALIDPDFLFARPLTPQVRSEEGILFSGGVTKKDLIEEVSEGYPVGQFYGIGDKWIEFNLTYIVGADSPALTVKSDPAWNQYSLGPPYIVHKQDMRKIANVWHEIVPRVYEGHPHLLAEMYAYSVAAAHLELPHLRLDNYMTSEADGYGEGWELVDGWEEEELCGGDLSEKTRRLPTFYHYCQHYIVGEAREFVFWKRDLDEEIMSCSGEELPIPSPQQVRDYLHPATDLDLGGSSKSEEQEKEEAKKALYRKRHVFHYCQISLKINKALRQYKDTFCEGEGRELGGVMNEQELKWK